MLSLIRDILSFNPEIWYEKAPFCKNQIQLKTKGDENKCLQSLMSIKFSFDSD